MSHLDQIAIALLEKLSPNGSLLSIANNHARGINPDLDDQLDQFDADEIAFQHLQNESFVNKLEDDFASIVPLLELAGGPLETWAIPLLAALAGPGAPLLSIGLTIACKVALAALQAWATKRAAQKH